MIRLGICSDLHYDLIHNAAERLAEFENAVKGKVDFIIHLGDFCFANEQNKHIAEKYRNICESYHVLGNHDMDHNTKQQAVDFFKMPNRYYSFDKNSYHFIVLDPNNLKLCDGFEPYGFGNYFAHKDKLNYIDDEQLRWLKADLQSTSLPCIIFSHQPLSPDGHGIKNSDELNKVIASCGGKVKACFNGHDHVDGVKNIDGVYYVSINSLSFFYMSSNINIIRYSESITQHYPILSQSCPYKSALYTVVEITDSSIHLSPKATGFVGPSPLESGHSGICNGFASSPEIKEKTLPL